MESELLIIGKIIGTHGIKGRLRVFPYAESQAAFLSQEFLFTKDKKGAIKKMGLTNVEPHRNLLLLKLDGISSIDEAEKLIGVHLLIERSKLSILGEDEYYWFEIIGLKVITESGAFLGEVERIIQTGGNDVYVIRKNGKEYLIPAIADVVTKIDIVNKIMTIHLLEGLFEDGEV